jgi:hypothetical protein
MVILGVMSAESCPLAMKVTSAMLLMKVTSKAIHIFSAKE